MKKSPWRVGPETVRMLDLGHPWVIADKFTKEWPSGKAGDLVEIADQQGRYLATALLDPGQRIVARILSRRPMKLDHTWIAGRLASALHLRRAHGDLGDTDAYRLVNAEGDGLPGLTVDCYGEYLLIQLYSAAWQPHLRVVAATLQELLYPLGIYVKARPQNTRELEAVSDNKRYGKLFTGKSASDPITVKENGLNFLVSMERGLNTGIFLDQRRNRRELMTRVAGKRVLNLFAYTGAFSVAAAAAGAAQVTSVDASAIYTEWAKSNFGANRLNPKKHEFIVGDCFSVLADLAARKKRFDIVLMDPPSFSTTTKSRFTTRRGTADLVAAALPLIPDGGLLITSSNHQKVETTEYLKELRRGALQAGCDVRVLSLAGQGEDFPYSVTFPEGRYLKYVTGMKEAW